jgi:putative transposase
MSDRATEVALFRYSLVCHAADVSLSSRARGALVRALAGRDHAGPGGEMVRVSRNTIDRWIRTLRGGGFEALKPSPRAANPRTPGEVLALAEALKREDPARTAAHVVELLVSTGGWSPHERTLQRHFVRLGLHRPATPASTFGRFEATRPNELWVGDALHGPLIAGRKAILFAFLDDHSRAFVGYRWAYSEDTVCLEVALRAGFESRGVPSAAYVDNGSAFVSSQLLRACAVLGIRLVHSQPGRPEGRGKIERVFRTVRDQFLVEVAHTTLEDLRALNEAFAAWVETVYHRAVHSETGEAPLERFLAAGPPALPTPAELHEAFLWAEKRMVTKTATVSLFSNRYEVDVALVGRRVELVFDPFDLSDIEVRFAGRSMGKATPLVIGRHSHPAARPEAAPPPTPSGIDYLALITRRHTEELARGVNYAKLAEAETPAPAPAPGDPPGPEEAQPWVQPELPVEMHGPVGATPADDAKDNDAEAVSA